MIFRFTLYKDLILCILFLFFFKPIYSISTSNHLTDFEYRIRIQEKRLKQNLEYQLRGYNYTDFILNDRLLDQKIVFKVFPSLYITKEKPIGIFREHVSISNGYWGFLVTPFITQDYHGYDLLGTRFERFGLNGRVTQSIIRFKNKNTLIQMGRAPIRWGQSWNNSIIQSGIYPSYDHILFNYKLDMFRMEILAGQLGSEFIGVQRIKRLIAGHRIAVLLTDKIFIEFGEQIIYTGENRSIEWVYVNPFIPYVFTAYENEEEVAPTGGDNDNGIIFFNGRYLLKKNLSIYSEIILDDFQIDNNNVQNMMGYKIGMDGGTKALKGQVTWEVEYTTINSWTYIHLGQFTNWQNRGHAIGYPYGSDVRSFRIQADSWLKKKLMFNIEYTWLEKGVNTINTAWGNIDKLNDSFPREPTSIYNLFQTSLSYWMKYGTVEIGWSNVPFAREIANMNNLKIVGGLFLRLQLQYQFSFDFNSAIEG